VSGVHNQQQTFLDGGILILAVYNMAFVLEATGCLQECPWKAALQDIAINASCQRLAIAAMPDHLHHLAAPELLRILKVLEGGPSTVVSKVERIPARLWQAVVPQLFSHLASPKVK
jgi:hypothetical protein